MPAYDPTEIEIVVSRWSPLAFITRDLATSDRRAIHLRQTPNEILDGYREVSLERNYGAGVVA